MKQTMALSGDARATNGISEVQAEVAGYEEDNLNENQKAAAEAAKDLYTDYGDDGEQEQ